MGMSLPIKNKAEINSIKNLYKKKNQTSELLMFMLAINTGMDLIGLLNLKVKDVKDKLYLNIKKNKVMPLNQDIRNLIKETTDGKKPKEYLFKNSSGSKFHRTTIFYAFKNICRELGLNNNYSVASWRKTFAYHHYEKYKDLSYLQWLFNQTTVDLTMKFIGIRENMNLRYRKGIKL